MDREHDVIFCRWLWDLSWPISVQSLQSPRPNHHCNAHPKHQYQPQTLFSHHKPVITLHRQSGSRTIQSSISGQPNLSPIHFHLLIRILSSYPPKKSYALHEPAVSRGPITRPINREMLVKKKKAPPENCKVALSTHSILSCLTPPFL